MKRSKWLVRRERAQRPALRIFALPYSGGNASAYADWHERLPANIELVAVQLPGRAERMSEPLVTTMQQLVDALLPELESELGQAYVLLGHSNGALIATALLQRIVAASLPAPRAIIVSGRASPTRPRARPAPSEMPDPSLIHWLRDLGGTPEELLGNPELTRLILPIVRADCSVGESFHLDPCQSAFSNLPGLILAGTHDAAAKVEDVFAWQDIFHDANTASFAGGHFFLLENPRALERIGTFLTGLIAPAWSVSAAEAGRQMCPPLSAG